jgi:hypothetical protein
MNNEINLMEATIVPSTDINSLNQIVFEVKAIMEMSTDGDLLFANSVDRDLSTEFFRILRKYCSCIRPKDVEAIQNERRNFGEGLYLMKKVFKVERPYVLAENLGVSLPTKNLTSKSGIGYSYPSIHAGESRHIAHNIAKRYSECLGDMGRHEIYNHANRIAMSRVHLGVHSLQDIREGIRLADLCFISYPHNNRHRLRQR